MEKKQRRSEQGYRLGNWVRRLRTEVGLSLRDVAKEAGVSASFLSQFENDKREASGTTLARILLALGVDSMGDFFNMVDRFEKPFHRRADRVPMVGPDEPLTIEYIGPRYGSFPFSVSYCEMQPGYHQDEPDDGPQYSCVFVLEGRLGVNLEGEEYEVGEGEAAFFDAWHTHTVWNLSKSVTKLMLIDSVPTRNALMQWAKSGSRMANGRVVKPEAGKPAEGRKKRGLQRA